MLLVVKVVYTNDLGTWGGPWGTYRMHLLVWLISPVTIKTINGPMLLEKSSSPDSENVIAIPSKVSVSLPASAISRNDIRWYERPGTCLTSRWWAVATPPDRRSVSSNRAYNRVRGAARTTQCFIAICVSFYRIVGKLGAGPCINEPHFVPHARGLSLTTPTIIPARQQTLACPIFESSDSIAFHLGSHSGFVVPRSALWLTFPPRYTNVFVWLYTWPAASTLNVAVDSGIPFAR